jgi:PilZ domain
MSRAERRTDIRFSARFDVRFSREGDAAHAFRVFSENFSPGGLCLKTKALRSPGEALRIDLTIGDESFALEGVVAWAHKGAIGVRFENLTTQVRTRLESIAAALGPTPQRGAQAPDR